MKIEMHEVGGGRKSLEAFAEQHGLVMEVRERPKSFGLARYLAHFKDVEVMRDGVLVGKFGNGDTPDEAIADYARQIEGHRLAYRAYQPDRREMQVPNDLTVSGQGDA